MNYSLAKLLKDHRFPQSLSKEAEYYIAPNILMHRKDIFQTVFHDSPREATTTNEFVYKPRLEELVDTNWEEVVNNWIEKNALS